MTCPQFCEELFADSDLLKTANVGRNRYYTEKREGQVLFFDWQYLLSSAKSKAVSDPIDANNSKNTSQGVLNPRHFLGLLFSLCPASNGK